MKRFRSSREQSARENASSAPKHSRATWKRSAIFLKKSRANCPVCPASFEGVFQEHQANCPVCPTFIEVRHDPYFTLSGIDIAARYDCVADDQYRRAFQRDRAI